jgi:hypothetical protein
MLETLSFSDNFDLGKINSYSILDEMNPDIFSQLPIYEIFIGYKQNYPNPIKLIKLIVSHANTISPTGPHEYIINNAEMGNNTILIKDSNIISAFNNSTTGYAFDINIQAIYYTRENDELVVNNFSQYIK